MIMPEAIRENWTKARELLVELETGDPKSDYYHPNQTHVLLLAILFAMEERKEK